MSDKNDKTLDLMHELLQKNGLQEWDVILQSGDSLQLSAQKGELDKFKVASSQVLGVRIIKDEKIGIAYTESFDHASLRDCIKLAQENAKVAKEKPLEKISCQNISPIIENLTTVDEMPTEDIIEKVKYLESEVIRREEKANVVPYNNLGKGHSRVRYLNSLNSFYDVSHSYASCYTSALIQDGKESSIHYEGNQAKRVEDLDLDFCIAESIKHAKNWLNAKQIKTGSYDVIFTFESLDELMRAFSGMYSGEAARLERNPFTKKIGQKLFSNQLTVKDLPKYEDAFFPTFCDGEGFEVKDLTLIENGTFQSFYHNSVTAKHFQIENNFHASRGAKSSLGVKGHTRVVMPGETSKAELEKGEYLVVHTLQGLHSGLNVMSGDFSFAASGYIFQDGSMVRPFKGVTIAGNYYQMLNEIKGIGREIESDSSRAFFSPQIRFENLSIAGA